MSTQPTPEDPLGAEYMRVLLEQAKAQIAVLENYKKTPPLGLPGVEKVIAEILKMELINSRIITGKFKD